MDPKRIAKLEQKAWSLVDVGEHDAAVATFDEAIAYAPGVLALALAKGVALFKMKRYDAALAAFDAIVASNPDNITAWNNKARVHVTLAQDREALACYKRILAVDDTHVATWHRAGELMTRQERYDKALNLFGTALALDPNNPEIHHARGIVYWKTGEIADALEHFAKALDLRGSFFEVFRDRARLHRGTGDTEAAIEDLRQALKHQPAATEVHLELGHVLLESGDADKAHAVFEALVVKDGECAPAWDGRGLALTAMGQPARGTLNQGTALMIQGQHEAALALFDQALELDPSYAQAWSNRAVVLERAGRLDEAAESYEKALTIDTAAVVVMHNLAMMLIHKLDRREDGLRWLRESIKHEPQRWFQLPSELRLAVDERKR